MKLRYFLMNLLHRFHLSKRYVDPYLFKKFDEYNEKYFEGCLPDIPIYVDNSLGCIWGRFESNTNLITRTITPLHILLNMKELKNEEDFLNVFVHEMVHYIECLNKQPTKEQWDKACAILDNNSHLDFSNKLILAGYWKVINDIINPYRDDKHSPYFEEFCHMLNELNPELSLRINWCGPKL